MNLADSQSNGEIGKKASICLTPHVSAIYRRSEVWLVLGGRGRGPGGGATPIRKCWDVCVGYLKMDPFGMTLFAVKHTLNGSRTQFIHIVSVNIKSE